MFVVTLVSSDVMLAVLDAILLVLVVMLELFEAISVVFVVTRPSNAVILEVFDVILFCKPVSAFVALVTSAVKLTLVEFILVVNPFSAFVALVISAVMLDVLDEIKVGNVAMVAELIPPTLFTVGADAVPPKSFANCNLPFVLASASGVADPPTTDVTNAVVAI